MNTTKVKKVLKWTTSALVSLVFLSTGGFKLAGAGAMVAIFEGFHLPLWFMYFTGAVEVSLAIGLFFHTKKAGLFAAAGLASTMLVAAGFHLAYDPFTKAIPALVLMMLCLLMAYDRRAVLKKGA